MLQPPSARITIRRMTSGLILLLGAWLLPGVLALADPPAVAKSNPETVKFFEAKVRPLLAEQCWSCHGADKQKGGLRLDSIEAILAGGENGPAIVPGKPGESLLVDAIHRLGPEMPPKGKLADDQVNALTKWVEIGAPWPQGAGHGASTDSANKKPSAKRTITDQDRQFWSYKPFQTVNPPANEHPLWSKNPIDRFLFAKLQTEKLSPAPEADRRTLIRRATQDLWGLPANPTDVDAFVNDSSPNAYENLVDRLLDSPRYGERWARHWLDLVRYAESDGHRQDAYRSESWRYRDYVIQSLNQDKPYNQFITEQLAGDEIAPNDPEMRIATSFLRHGTYEFNQRDARAQWRDNLNDLTDVAGDLFLGMSVGCARCHDHKFDPILQEDYYKLQAFFTPILPRDDLPLTTPQAWADYQEKLATWEEKTAEIRQKIAVLEKPYLDREAKGAIEKFTTDLQAISAKPESERTPHERQLGYLIHRQVLEEWNKLAEKIKGNDKKAWDQLQKELKRFEADKPQAPAFAMTITDVGPISPPTLIPGDRSNREIMPGFPTVLVASHSAPPRIPTPTSTNSTGRRSTLARWLTKPDNPLPSRVIVNRIWQYHFGRGLVATSSDFGKLGETPSHPELLEWLAGEFVKQGGGFKKMHRLMMTSSAYRQASEGLDAQTFAMGQRKDPENRWLWRGSARRIDAEQIRDAMLVASGELVEKVGGPSEETTVPRRTIYTKVIRNTRDPLLDAFDSPESFSSVANRYYSTTALQSLLLLNGEWTLARGKAFAKSLRKAAPDDERQQIDLAYRKAFGRSASSDEIRRGLSFLADQKKRADNNAETALADFCHGLLNANEFLYIP